MEIQAVVQRKRKTRKGRGFSRAELKDAGMDCRRALRLGIPIDLRRNTKHEENIELLMQYSVKPRAVERRKKERSREE